MRSARVSTSRTGTTKPSTPSRRMAPALGVTIAGKTLRKNPDGVRAQAAGLKAVAAHFVMLSEERRVVMHAEREVLATLVERYTLDPGLLDPLHREAYEAATDDGGARRAVLDQVASLSDARALSVLSRTAPGGMP